jgi:hypothetical protein
MEKFISKESEYTAQMTIIGIFSLFIANINKYKHSPKKIGKKL